MQFIFALLFVFLNLTIVSFADKLFDGITWGYNKNIKIVGNLEILSPDKWFEQYPDCNGENQSPVNIVHQSTQYDKTLNPILFSSNVKATDEHKSIWTRKNNGHTIQYALDNNTINTVFNSETFSLVQMHFHWGHSEHEINGKLQKAEIHLVHQSVNNASIKAVLGFLFRVNIIRLIKYM